MCFRTDSALESSLQSAVCNALASSERHARETVTRHSLTSTLGQGASMEGGEVGWKGGKRAAWVPLCSW